MPGGYSYIKPPGQRNPAPNPVQSVANFQNQELGGLSTGTGAQVGSQASAVQPGAGIAPRGQSEVALSTSRTTNAVRDNSRKLLANAQVARQRQQALEAQKARQSQSRSRGNGGGYGGGQRYQNPSGGNNQQGVVGAGGTAVNRLQGILRGFPGLRITEVGGNREYDVAHGVARVPNSYHYDRANPAVDIAGSTADLNRLYKQLVQSGGWRQILWQVPGHYDHIHVAAEGGLAGAGVGDPLGTAIATDPSEIPEGDTELTALNPGEFVMTKKATDLIGPENLAAANEGAEMETAAGSPPAPAGAPQMTGPARVPGMDVTALASMAYGQLGQNVAQHTRGSSIPGVRTALRNLRPGDLVAWRDGSHIAVYAGNGEVADISSPERRRKLWAPESAVYGIALRLPGE